MANLSSRLAVILAFFCLVLLVVVKEKFFKMVEHFMGGGHGGSGRHHGHGGGGRHHGHGGRGTKHAYATIGGNGGGGGWDIYPYAPVFWNVVDYDMSKPCRKSEDCLTKRCTQFGFCAYA